MILRPPDLLNASILIVDDQASNVMLLEQLLSDAGYSNVSSTMNPVDVCALHSEHAYDLILLDLQMPIMDGFHVMESLKANSDDSYLPVIVLTAQPAHKLNALQAGAKDFISKPFDLVEVKTRIHNMLEVRLLYKKLDNYNKVLEDTVRERTLALRVSETRFRKLTELASDWYWEQDAEGSFTNTSASAMEMLGIVASPPANKPITNADHLGHTSLEHADCLIGWNEQERMQIQNFIATRQPFLDFAFSRINAAGLKQYFRISGEPIFDLSCRFRGFRGIGIECKAMPN